MIGERARLTCRESARLGEVVATGRERRGPGCGSGIRRPGVRRPGVGRPGVRRPGVGRPALVLLRACALMRAPRRSPIRGRLDIRRFVIGARPDIRLDPGRRTDRGPATPRGATRPFLVLGPVLAGIRVLARVHGPVRAGRGPVPCRAIPRRVVGRRRVVVRRRPERRAVRGPLGAGTSTCVTARARTARWPRPTGSARIARAAGTRRPASGAAPGRTARLARSGRARGACGTVRGALTVLCPPGPRPGPRPAAPSRPRPAWLRRSPRRGSRRARRRPADERLVRGLDLQEATERGRPSGIGMIDLGELAVGALDLGDTRPRRNPQHAMRIATDRHDPDCRRERPNCRRARWAAAGATAGRLPARPPAAVAAGSGGGWQRWRLGTVVSFTRTDRRYPVSAADPPRARRRAPGRTPPSSAPPRRRAGPAGPAGGTGRARGPSPVRTGR